MAQGPDWAASAEDIYQPQSNTRISVLDHPVQHPISHTSLPAAFEKFKVGEEASFSICYCFLLKQFGDGERCQKLENAQ